MPPKKKTKFSAQDERQQKIASFFQKTSPAACSSNKNLENISPVRSSTPLNNKSTSSKVKEENGQESMGHHSHSWKVKFNPSDRRKYTIYCDRPQTVLEAIKSHVASKKKLKSPNENIVIQLGREDKGVIIPTHFPCCLVEHDKTVTVSCKSEMIEKAQNQQHKMFHPIDKYPIFYIDTVGGLNAKTKEIFQSNIVKKYKRLCVYGEEGMTVEEVLRRDGRFNDLLSDFTLSDNDNPNSLTSCTQKVNRSLDQKTFKIQLEKGKSDVSESPSQSAQCNSEERSAVEIAQQRGNSVRTLIEKQGDGVDITEIYDLLRKQFPLLREWMENRFTADSYQECLDFRKENFNRHLLSYNQFYRFPMLQELGKSVCKITVQNVCQGTGFVLFDRFILTNAHLFTNLVDEDQKVLEGGIDVFALFNYVDPNPNANVYYFTAERRLAGFDRNLDYAVLELNPQGFKSNQPRNVTSVKMPPGLLKKFGPLPENGEACIIGHPAGTVITKDPVLIIDKAKRGSSITASVNQLPYVSNMPGLVISARQYLKNKGIDDIMIGGGKEGVITYKTFMYHGSSGSPVFDALGRVVGLHTAGYTVDFGPVPDNIIEFAYPLLDIFQSFVEHLKDSRNYELLAKVRKEAEENQWLQGLLGDELADVEEPMEEGPMGDS